MAQNIDNMLADLNLAKDLLIELDEVKNRILSLQAQVLTPNTFRHYDARVLALEQLKAMQEYAEVLICRIEFIKEND